MTNENALTVKNLSVNFEGFQALEKVNISFKSNEVHALIGPNGAGKTTIIDIITGKTLPTEGDVYIGSEKITGRSIYQISRWFGIGRKFQGANVFDDLTVYENLFISFRKYKKANVLKSILIDKNNGKEEIYQALKLINLVQKKDLKAFELSHGQRQWLEIGMVMVQKPQVIILDEPTAGMTISETGKTEQLIKQLSKSFSIIVVEHDMDFIKQVADVVTVLDHGQVISEGNYEEVKNDPKVAAVYLNTSK